MSPPRASKGILPNDLFIELGPWPRIGRPPRHDLSVWTVTDDWPERVPVTLAEVDVFEAWFGDLFDELFGPALKWRRECPPIIEYTLITSAR